MTKELKFPKKLEINMLIMNFRQLTTTYYKQKGSFRGNGLTSNDCLPYEKILKSWFSDYCSFYFSFSNLSRTIILFCFCFTNVGCIQMSLLTTIWRFNYGKAASEILIALVTLSVKQNCL